MRQQIPNSSRQAVVLFSDSESDGPRQTKFGHVRTVKAQISLRIRAVWSGPLLSANRIIGYNRTFQWRAITRMKLCACAWWFDWAQFAHAQRHFFAWRGPDEKASFISLKVSYESKCQIQKRNSIMNATQLMKCRRLPMRGIYWSNFVQIILLNTDDKLCMCGADVVLWVLFIASFVMLATDRLLLKQLTSSSLRSGSELDWLQSPVTFFSVWSSTKLKPK